MATRTISTKLVIDGESEYRSAVSRINTELKTLQSNLKLTESQYQTNANSMEALKAKHDALSSMIDAQKSKVETLREALNNAKSAQEIYAQNCADLREKIQANGEAMEKLKASSGDTSKEQKALADETAKLKKELEEEEAKLSAAEKGVNSWQTQLNNAEIKMNELDSELQKNDKLMDEAKNSADGCAHSIDEFGNEVKESAEETDKQNDALDALAAALAAGGVVAGIHKITEALKACVEASMDFEAAMSGVGAISSATSDEMAQLSDKAKEIGASTMFTAGQAAEAMQYMALAGWSAKEMLEGVDSVIQLAAASGENLATVSDIVTDALTAFGLKAEDSGHFVDVLAKTAASSNTTVTMLGEAFKYAAPLAGALGYSVEDVAVAIGLMANNGIKGSQAGTTLRTMFSKLTGEVTLTSQAFGEAKVSASNADGSMKPLSETLQELRSYFMQMTDAEKLANAEALAGKYALSGLTAIMNSTEEDFDSLTLAIQDCTGAAEEMANVRMDNLEGQVTLMKSAFDALKIAVGDDLNPALRGLAETGTDVLTWASEFVEEHKMLVPLVSALTAGLVTLTGTIAAAAITIKAVEAAQEALNLVMDANPILLVASAAATLLAVLVTLNATLPTTDSEYRILTATSKDQYDKIQALNAEYERACEIYGQNSDEAKKLADQIDAETQIYERNKQTLVEVIDAADALIAKNQESRTEYEKTTATITKSYDTAGYLIGRLNDLMQEEGKTAGTKQQILSVVEALNEQIPNLGLKYDSYADSLSMTTDQLEKLANAEKDRQQAAADAQRMVELEQRNAEIDAELLAVRAELEAATLRVKDAEAARNEALSQYSDNDLLTMAYNVNSALDSYVDAVIVANQQVEDLTETEQGLSAEFEKNSEEIEQLSTSTAEFAETAEGSAQAAQNAAAAFGDSLAELATDYKNAYDAAKESFDAQFGLWEEVGTLADQKAREVSESVEKAWDNAYKAAEKSVQGQFGLLDQVKEAKMNQAEEMIGAMQSQEEYWTLYMDLVNSALDSGIDGVDAWVAQFLDGSQESAAALAGFANASDEEKAKIIEAFEALMTKRAEVTRSITALKTSGSEDLAELASATTLSVESMIAAQESQQAYWEEYSANLDALLSRNVEGVEGLAKAFGDGSAESAQALAVLAGATDEEIGAIIASMARTDEARSNLATTAAGIETDFSARLEALKNEFEATMQHLGEESGKVDFSPFISEVQKQFNEAGTEIYKVTEESGKNADAGFKNGLELDSGEVYLASEAVGQGVIDALKTILDENSPSKVTEEIGENADLGLAGGIENEAGTVTDAAEELSKKIVEILTEGGKSSVEGFDAEFLILKDKVREHMDEAKVAVDEATSELEELMRYAGESMIQGMIDGLYNQSGGLYSAVADIVSSAVEVARAEAGVHSPSWKTEAIFENVGEGMIVGVEKKKEDVAAATQDVVNEALSLDTSGISAAMKLMETRVPDLSPLLSGRSSGADQIQAAQETQEVPSSGTDMRATEEKLDRAVSLLGQISAEIADLRVRGRMI